MFLDNVLSHVHLSLPLLLGVPSIASCRFPSFLKNEIAEEALAWPSVLAAFIAVRVAAALLSRSSTATATSGLFSPSPSPSAGLALLVAVHAAF